MNCAYCHSHLEPRGDYPIQRCYGCKEKLPPGQSLKSGEDSFLPNRYGGERNPELIWMHSLGKIIWLCPEGHRWKGAPRDLLQGRRCPHCYGRKQPKQGNSLQDRYSDLADEWCHHNQVRARDISFATGLRGCWICSMCGHHWSTTVKARSSGSRTGCPSCNALSFTSRGENELYQAIKELYPDAQQGIRGLISNRELDIYIPSRAIALEYNGEYWHSDAMISERHGISAEAYHREKLELCRARGICLLYVWESQWISDKRYMWLKVLSVLNGEVPPRELSYLSAPDFDIPL